ncbi:MAG: hypothetical protein WCP22_10390 [Chlamydiota bacterium]
MNLKEQEDLLVKVEKAKEQIAKLRKQQADLEREKTELEDLEHRQEEWYRGKKELSDALVKALAVLENEESEVTRLAALVKDARGNFAKTLEQLAGIREDRWTPATLKDDLNRALILLQRGRTELSEAKARVPALEGRPRDEERPELDLGGEGIAARAPGLRAGELLRIGFWLALPAAVMAAVLGALLALM